MRTCVHARTPAWVRIRGRGIWIRERAREDQGDYSARMRGCVRTSRGRGRGRFDRLGVLRKLSGSGHFGQKFTLKWSKNGQKGAKVVEIC